MYSCSNDITTAMIPFVKQRTSVILLILLNMILKAEKVVGRKHRMNVFYDNYILFQAAKNS